MCLEGAHDKLERFFSLCPFSFEPALGQIARARAARAFIRFCLSLSPLIAPSQTGFSFLAYETYPNEEEATDHVDYDEGICRGKFYVGLFYRKKPSYRSFE